MNALDSPLEALAFNYLSYGLLTAVNSIWTWVAVITAAVSFWRIKVLSSSASSVVGALTSEHPRDKIPDGSTPVRLKSPSPAQRIAAEREAELPEPASTSHQQTTPSFGALEREGSTKGKFTLYYENEDGRCRVDDNGKGEENGGGGVVGEWWWDRWERVVRMRMGDEKWYSYQDLTIVNGNVVRLWEDRRRRNAAPLELVGGVTW